MEVSWPPDVLDAAPRLGLGLAALGRPAYINLGHAGDLGGRTDPRAMERTAHEVLDVAYQRGLRYFDAARSYGMAEAFLASWLQARNFGPDEVAVGSKWGYTYTAAWRVDAEVNEVKELSLATLVRQLGETSQLLGSNLGLYEIHSATIDSGVLEDRAVLDELHRLRSTGVAIGLTVTGAHQADTIERALELGGFDAVQATWNLLERSAGHALARAHEAGLWVIVKEALANGRLTARGADVPQLADAADRAGTTSDAFALAAVLAQPWADMVLSGAVTIATLASNLEALRLELDPATLAELAEEPETYWRERSELPWN